MGPEISAEERRQVQARLVQQHPEENDAQIADRLQQYVASAPQNRPMPNVKARVSRLYAATERPMGPSSEHVPEFLKPMAMQQSAGHPQQRRQSAHPHQQ